MFYIVWRSFIILQKYFTGHTLFILSKPTVRKKDRGSQGEKWDVSSETASKVETVAILCSVRSRPILNYHCKFVSDCELLRSENASGTKTIYSGVTKTERTGQNE